MARHPAAIWKPTASGNGLKFSSLANPKIVLHTTETAGLPSYAKGAPHFTLDLDDGTIWQHIDTEFAAYTLRSNGPPNSPNMDAGAVYQIEVIAYAGHSPGLELEDYQRIAGLLAWLSVEHNVPARITPEPFNDSSGYGTDAPQRLSWSEFVAFSGLCGHQHAPSPNTHWDPGEIDKAALEAAWRDALGGDDEDPAGVYPLRYGDASGDIQYVRQLLKLRGHDVDPKALEYNDELAGAVLEEFPNGQPEGKRFTGRQAALLLWRLFRD
jgi:hypothetical protein